MKSVTITIRTGNAAFQNDMSGTLDPGPELARILRNAANLLEDKNQTPESWGKSDCLFRLYDANGNHVGEITTT